MGHPDPNRLRLEEAAPLVISESRPRPVLSVVVPVFNEQDSVGELAQRVIEACRPLKEPFELVVVNDGSQDDTLWRLIELSRTVPEIRIIDLFRNFGHMPALSAGIRLAGGEAVVVMDGDLQDPPELIPKFFSRWKEGADVVYGLRTERRESFLRRRATSFFYWLLSKITETRIPEQVGTFCLMDRRVAEILNSLPERDRYFAGLRAWVGGKQSFVTYVRLTRSHGRSRVGTKGLLRLARTALISFSKAPLRYASLLSLACGLALFLVGLVAITIRLFTNLAIPGWATFTTLLGMMGFVQSIVLAVIAEYIAVIFDELKARPLFLIRQQYTHGEPIHVPSPKER
ncbi:MAG: glycosyltransferase family 2 protein [Candidatus Omnitrophica bacterium]|nr:glycosyltransferase family 2 protein [Candidatus Omnitrophota bacterium]